MGKLILIPVRSFYGQLGLKGLFFRPATSPTDFTLCHATEVPVDKGPCLGGVL